MDQQHNQPHISHQRRNFMRGAAAAAGAAALTHPLSVLAQGAEEIVIGGSIPMRACSPSRAWASTPVSRTT